VAELVDALDLGSSVFDVRVRVSPSALKSNRHLCYINIILQKLRRDLTMDALTYNQAKENFTAIMSQVCENHTPMIITDDSQKPVVVISLADYNAIEETLYLLRSPKNARRLYKALDDLKQGNYEEHSLIEDE